MIRPATAVRPARSTADRAIAPLERDGYVVLSVDPADARVKRAELTGAGVARIREIRPYWQLAQDSFMAAVGDTAWNVVSDGLDELRASIANDPDVSGQLRRTGR